MADQYTPPDQDIDQTDDPGGLRAFLTRSDVDPDAQQESAPAPPNVDDASTQPRIAPPTGPSIPTPSYQSQAPQYQAPDDSKLQALIAQRKTDAAPVDPKSVSPKWYERLGGALAAGSMAFGHEPGALEAGSAITNQRANAANAARASKIQEDDAEIQQETANEDRQAKQYEAQLQGYRAGLEGAGVDQRAQAEANAQSNADRQYQRESANDTFNQNRDKANDTFDHDYKNRDLTQRGADAAANTRIASGRLSVEQQRLKDDEDAAGGTGPNARNAKLQTAISQKYGDLTDKLENGDPKGATPEEQKGFKQNYRETQQSKVNPDTGDPWQQGEQQQYLQNLKQQNADRKNSYAARQRDELANAGRNVPLVQYDAEGRVISAPPVGQPPAPPAATQPQMAPQNTGTTPNRAVTTGLPAAPTQQQAPQVKVKAGTVTVGTPVVFNGKKGTVTGINPQSGKPIVAWEQ
jgi:hypothetical protein